MNSLVIENNVLKQFTGNERSITVTKGIKRIDEYAFSSSAIEHIIFEDESLKIVSDYAFKDAAHLKELVLPKSVISIGTGAFEGCRELEYLLVPPSVLDIDGKIFDIDSKTIIVGKENSLAEQYAKENNIVFRNDLGSFRQTENADINVMSCSAEFNIFGVKVACSKGYKDFIENKNYYEKQKTVLFNDLLKMLPSSLADSKATIKKEAVTKLNNDAVTRLKNKGCVVTSELIEGMTASSCVALFNVIIKYYELASNIAKGLKTDITNMRIQLDEEAASKIRGVNYGVLGGPLDLVLYNIDNAITARRQYDQAMREANALNSQYTKQLNSKANTMIKELYKNIQPVLKEAVDAYLDDLRNAVDVILNDAGKYNIDVIGLVDVSKASSLYRSVDKVDEDAAYKIGLALKYNPYEEQFYKKAFELGIVSKDLLNMMSFLDLCKPEHIDQYFFSLCKKNSTVNKCLEDLLENEKHMSNPVLSLYRQRIKSLLATAKKEYLKKELNTLKDPAEYCEESLKTVVDKALYQKVGSLKISYEQVLEDWISTRKKILDAYPDKSYISDEEYDLTDVELSYRQLKERLSSNSEILDLDEIILRLQSIKEYKDSLELLNQARTKKHGDAYQSCINSIEEAESVERLDGIISTLRSMANYKESAHYLEIAQEKRALLKEQEKKREIEELLSRVDRCESESDYLELKEVLKPLINSFEYKAIYDKLIYKKNERLREQCEALLSTASSKNDYVQIREMMNPYKGEIGINDLYSNVNRIIQKIEKEEEVAPIIANADKATTVEDFDEIIYELSKISFGNSVAREQKQIMLDRKDQLILKNKLSQVMARAVNVNSLEGYDAVLKDLEVLQSLGEAQAQKKTIEEKRSQLAAEIHMGIKDRFLQIETMEELDEILSEIQDLPDCDKQMYDKLISDSELYKTALQMLEENIRLLEEENAKNTSFFKRKEREEIQKQIAIKKEAAKLTADEALSDLKKLL